MSRIIDKYVLSILQRNAGQIQLLLAPKEEKRETAEDNISDTYRKDMCVADFQQCMYMLRHYDNVNWDLTKFAFGQVLVAIGACWTILNYKRDSWKTWYDVYSDGVSNYIVGGILLLSVLFVIITLAAILRNRSYFVLMSRYLNEHRRNVLLSNPFGFKNESKMWCNPNFPIVKDWRSTQMFCVYLFSVILIIFLWGASYSLLFNLTQCVCWSLLITFVIVFMLFLCMKAIAI